LAPTDEKVTLPIEPYVIDFSTDPE
jgi:hypothetical protein